MYKCARIIYVSTLRVGKAMSRDILQKKGAYLGVMNLREFMNIFKIHMLLGHINILILIWMKKLVL